MAPVTLEVIKEKTPIPVFALPDVEYRYAGKILFNIQLRGNGLSNIAERGRRVGDFQFAFGVERFDQKHWQARAPDTDM